MRVALLTTEGGAKRFAGMAAPGVTHWLQKPFRAAELRAMVLELFADGP